MTDLRGVNVIRDPCKCWILVRYTYWYCMYVVIIGMTLVVVACLSLLAAGGASGQSCTDSFYCDADFCSSDCKPSCTLNPPEGGECNGIIMQLYI